MTSNIVRQSNKLIQCEVAKKVSDVTRIFVGSKMIVTRIEEMQTMVSHLTLNCLGVHFLDNVQISSTFSHPSCTFSSVDFLL